MTKVIQTFHDNIKSGPEYVCTFSDQLWYRSSVRKCEANKYRKYSATLLVTTTAIIDNAKRICFTSQSNLSNRKLPVCSTANKMGIPSETTTSKLDTFRRKINFSAYSIYADT